MHNQGCLKALHKKQKSIRHSFMNSVSALKYSFYWNPDSKISSTSSYWNSGILDQLKAFREVLEQWSDKKHADLKNTTITFQLCGESLSCKHPDISSPQWAYQQSVSPPLINTYGSVDAGGFWRKRRQVFVQGVLPHEHFHFCVLLELFRNPLSLLITAVRDH